MVDCDCLFLCLSCINVLCIIDYFKLHMEVVLVDTWFQHTHTGEECFSCKLRWRNGVDDISHSHFLVVFDLMVFSVVVSKVSRSPYPLEYELLLCMATSQPVEMHIYGFWDFMYHCLCDKSMHSGVICCDHGFWLAVSYFFKHLLERYSIFAIIEQGSKGYHILIIVDNARITPLLGAVGLSLVYK